MLPDQGACDAEEKICMLCLRPPYCAGVSVTDGSVSSCRQLYLVSIPVVVVCLFGSFYLMLVSFWAEEYLTLHRDQYGGNLAAVLIMLPSVIYSVVVLVLNQYYNKMTTFLTEWGELSVNVFAIRQCFQAETRFTLGALLVLHSCH